MRLRSMVNMMDLNGNDIREHLQRGEAEDQQLQILEKRLMQNLDTLTAAGADKERDEVSLRLAQTRAKRESLQRVRAALLERQLDARVRVLAVRYVHEVKRGLVLLEAERKAAQELRNGIRAVGTLNRKYLRADEAVRRYLARLGVLPSAAEQFTWTEMSKLFELRRAFPTTAEIQQATAHDATRPPRMGWWEWGGRPVLYQAIASGDGLRHFYERESPESLEQIEAVVRNDPGVMKILDTLKTDGTKQPQARKPRQSKSRKPRRSRGGKVL